MTTTPRCFGEAFRKTLSTDARSVGSEGESRQVRRSIAFYLTPRDKGAEIQRQDKGQE